MEFPCDKCETIKINNSNSYNICNECELIIKYEIWKDKQDKKEYKNKILQKGKGKNNNGNK